MAISSVAAMQSLPGESINMIVQKSEGGTAVEGAGVRFRDWNETSNNYSTFAVLKRCGLTLTRPPDAGSSSKAVTTSMTIHKDGVTAADGVDCTVKTKDADLALRADGDSGTVFLDAGSGGGSAGLHLDGASGRVTVKGALTVPLGHMMYWGADRDAPAEGDFRMGPCPAEGPYTFVTEVFAPDGEGNLGWRRLNTAWHQVGA